MTFEPSPATRALLERARTTLGRALDDLHGRLLDITGEIAVRSKTDGTQVTDADDEVDERLRTLLVDAFPDHGVLSEEHHTLAPDTDWTWIVDPIDGTSNFTYGLPYWCISVALALEGRVVLGIVDAPVVGRRYVATAGSGTEVELRTGHPEQATPRARRQLHVRERTNWRDGRNRHIPLMLTTGTAKRARPAGIKLKPRIMGSTALDLALVAEGSAAASVAVVPKVWDIAAGTLLVEEAGGAVLTPAGEGLLPLRRGVEHAGRSAVTLSGPDERYLHELAEVLEIADRSS